MRVILLQMEPILRRKMVDSGLNDSVDQPEEYFGRAVLSFHVCMMGVVEWSGLGREGLLRLLSLSLCLSYALLVRGASVHLPSWSATGSHDV